MEELLVRPKPCTWFHSSGIYEGDGTVYSETLGKAIAGSFSIRWDDLGSLSIECSPNNLDLVECLKITEDFDMFRDLTVSTDTGCFRARQCYINGPSFSLGDTSSSATLRFSTLDGTFVSSKNVSPSIWNASITNFIMDLRNQPGVAEHHPLRSYQIFTIPEDFPSERLDIARFFASGKNRIVLFDFKGTTAYIEHIAAYDEVKADLKERRSFNRVTSMMVGEIPDGAGLEPDDVRKWFPVDVLFGLTFASGSRVGLGVIDLRDCDGQFCGRIHLKAASGSYMEGHETLSDLVHSNAADSGLGAFLTGLLKANDVSMRRIRLLAAAIDLAQGSLETPDHAFAFIVRALDGLANDLRLSKSNLRAELPAETGDLVGEILSATYESIRRLLRGGGSSADDRAKATLVRIADRALSADSTDDKFGLSLGRILSYYRLDDEAAVALFYAMHPRRDGFTWTQALDVYRGGAIHRGFIDFATGIEIMDVVCCTRHLIDIAIRICLREMGYGGTYNPMNMAATQQSPVDWVKTDKSIGLFGYNGMIPKMINFVEVNKQAE